MHEMKHPNHRKNDKQKSSRRETVIVLFFAAILLLLLAAIFFWLNQGDEPEAGATVTTAADTVPSASSDAGTTEQPTESQEALHPSYAIDGFTVFASVPESEICDGLRLLCAGLYSGEYVEDGTDEEVTDVLALIVENCGDDIIELASIQIPCGDRTVTFEVTGLPVTGKCFVLAQARATCDDEAALGTPTATVTYLADRTVLDFGSDFELHGETDRILTLRNISGQSAANVCLYYKNFRDGLFRGGITYRVNFGTIEDDMPLQKYSAHYTADASVILYMSYDLP